MNIYLSIPQKSKARSIRAFCVYMPQKHLRRVYCNIIGTKCNKVGTKCNSVSSVNRFFCSMISKEQER